MQAQVAGRGQRGRGARPDRVFQEVSFRPPGARVTAEFGRQLASEGEGIVGHTRPLDQ